MDNTKNTMSNLQEYKQQQQEKTNIEDEFQGIFGGSSFSDDDLLKTVDKHTLQLDGDQMKSIMYLRSLNNPFMDVWVDQYLELKHHNRSGDLIIQALSSISLRKFISAFRFNVNTNK